jgi:hypothetical protein
MNLPKLILFIFININPIFCLAQIQVNLHDPPSGNFNPSDAWNVTIINLSQQNAGIYLMGSIKDLDNHELVNLRSQPVLLRPGTNRLTRDQVLTAQVSYLDESVKKTAMQTGNLPTGEYEICTFIYLQGDMMEAASDCHVISYTNLSENSKDRSGSKKWTRYVDLYGHGSVENFISDRQGTGQEIPSDYTRLDLQASAALMNVPVTLGAFYTTEQNSSRPDINAISLSFDSEHFRETLRDLVTRQAIALAEQQSSEILQKLTKVEELDKLNRIIEDPALLNEIGQLDNLEQQLQTVRQDLETGNLEESIKQAKTDEMSKLNQQLQTLRAKKAQLDKIRQRARQLVKFRDELEASGGMEALKELDPEQLQDPKFLKNELQKYGLFNGSNKFFFGIRNLAIGTTFPYYTPLTLNGIKVDGGAIELNPGLFYLNFVAGKTQSSVYSPESAALLEFHNTMLAGKIGLGNPGSNHFHLMGIGFRDRKNDLTEDTGTSTIRPESNYLVGSDLALGLFKDHIRFDGEVAFSSYNKDVLEDPVILDSALSKKLPDFIEPNTSTALDFAVNLGLLFNLFQGNTRLKINTRYIGPGYFSFGSPNLRRDVRRIGFRIDQYLARRKFQIFVHYRRDMDNLLDSKNIQTDNLLAGGGLQFRMKKLPFIRINYDLNQQKNELRNFRINNFNVVTSHFYPMGNWTASTNLSFNYVTNSNDSILGKYKANYISLGQTFTSPSRINLTINLTHSNVDVNGDANRIEGADLTTGFRIARIVHISIGGNYYFETGDNSRLGGHGMINIPLFGHLNLGVDARYNNFDDVLDPLLAFEEFWVRTVLSASW